MNTNHIFTFCLGLGLAACATEDNPFPQDMSQAPSTMDPSPQEQPAVMDNQPPQQPGNGMMPNAPMAGNDGPEPMMMDMTTPEPAMPADYSNAQNWLCRPDNNDHCAVNLDTTIVNADGTTTAEPFVPAENPEFDCFYVYPTVSLDETPNSDLVPGPEEAAVVRAQFARFAQHCRLYAPMYRQITLTALRSSLGGMPLMADRALAYQDVAAAFKHYLDNDNQGRGFLLIGHSQGSGMLTQLVKEELDTDPVDSRLITAMIIGSSVTVPESAAVGGSFQHVPVCESDDQLGCVITYASFRSDSPPPESSFFARSSTEGQVAACTNPAAVGGGAAELHAYLSTEGPGASGAPMGDWATGVTIDTPFVSVPGLLTAECKFAKTGYYLDVTLNSDPADARTDVISGDVVVDGEIQTDWGLHLIDVHLGMGNLLDLAATKASAYLAAE